MINGIINVKKEQGFTSFDVVAKLRGILHQKKIGHTGTLDPDATGVLPVCLGSATKVCELLTDKRKEYEAVLLLGTTTDTLDITGNVLKEREAAVTEEQVRAAVASFEGDIMQIPPMYSALKVDGRRLYELARNGVTVERKPRPVTIYAIEILDVSLPEVRFRVECSKGTYIRTLCDDIGEKLGCGGCMKSLIRTRVSEFRLDQALTLGEIEELVRKEDYSFVSSVDSVFLAYPKVTAVGAADKLVDNGNRLPRELVDAEKETGEKDIVRLYDACNHFIGLYEYDGQMYKPIKLFFDR